VIFESVIDWNPCHPDIHARFQRIAVWIEPQNRRMFCDTVAEENHINIVVKVFFFLKGWVLPVQ
jgi:hypothetical protein